MSNYPPGMSSRDFVRAGIDQPHDHEHEWRHGDMDNPVIEDGAAIFHERCHYTEGRYGEGWECEETRTYRFEYNGLHLPNGETLHVPTIENWSDASDRVQHKVEEIESEWRDNGEIHVDPDPDDGEVAIEYDGYTLSYRPEKSQ